MGSQRGAGEGNECMWWHRTMVLVFAASVSSTVACASNTDLFGADIEHGVSHTCGSDDDCQLGACRQYTSRQDEPGICAYEESACVATNLVFAPCDTTCVVIVCGVIVTPIAPEPYAALGYTRCDFHTGPIFGDQNVWICTQGPQLHVD